MTDVTPAKLADTKIRVLNASGQGGQAAEVAGALRDLGFAEPTAANDPVYVNARLECQGQIRFGPSGRAAAAAVWLVAPCTELFQDERSDDTVDLAIGTEFTELTAQRRHRRGAGQPAPGRHAARRPGAAGEDPRRRLLALFRWGRADIRRSQSARTGASASASASAMPGAAATTAPAPPSTGGSSSFAPASAAISAPAAQSQTCTPSS